MTVKELINKLRNMSQSAEVFVLYDCEECAVCSNLNRERCSHKRVYEFFPDLNDVRETSTDSVLIEIYE